MSDNTKIEWTDATWNPVTGCDEVSPGCDHCYAKTFAERWRGTPGHHFENGFDVQLRPGKLDQPLRWKRPRRIFVNSMSDLFHDQVPDEYIAKVFAVMALAPQHTFQVLTKRHGRMRSLLSRESFPELVTTWAWRINAGRARSLHRGESGYSASAVPWPLHNVWLGVSAEDQHWADIRIPALLDTPAGVRFVSAEPLLGPVEIGPWLNSWRRSTMHRGQPEHLDWVIVGGESGHGARPMHPDWVRIIRDQCQAAGVPLLFKQWGDASLWRDRQGDIWAAGDDGLMHSRETAPFHREHVERKWGPLTAVRSKAAGRELDGRTWDEFPHTPDQDHQPEKVTR